MIKYILKRILLIIPVFLGVMLLIFAISKMAGDPVDVLLSSDATVEQKEAKRAELGLDKSFPEQFFLYIKGVVTKFDLGKSYQNNRPIKNEVLDRYPTSLKLALISICISVVIGIPLGILSAVKQNSVFDYIATGVSLLCAAMPAFLLALVLILIFSLNLKWLPASGLSSWKHWILPCLALGITPVASICRTTRSNMLEVIRQDYIRTARAKGISERKIIWKHALKNALIPVITVVGMQVGVIVGGSVVVESVFSIPGIGTLIKNGVNNNDYPPVMGALVVLSLTISVLNLIVDLIYGYIDPRIKAQYSGGKSRKKKEDASSVVPVTAGPKTASAEAPAAGGEEDATKPDES